MMQPFIETGSIVKAVSPKARSAGRRVRAVLFCFLLATTWGATPATNLRLVASEPGSKLAIPTEFGCRRATGSIKLDGRANEPAWTNAVVIETFVAYWTNRSARTKTKARLLWNDDYLYFHAELEDSDLYAKVCEENGRTWDDDVFELFFCPDDSSSNYYEFQVNAMNTHFNDLFASRGAGGPRRFTSKRAFHWKTVVKLDGTLNHWQDTDKGWFVEGRIPWSDFAPTGGKPKVGDTWRFALCRYDYSKNFYRPDLSSCAPLQSLSFHRYEDYCRLRFLPAPVP